MGVGGKSLMITINRNRLTAWAITAKCDFRRNFSHPVFPRHVIELQDVETELEQVRQEVPEQANAACKFGELHEELFLSC